MQQTFDDFALSSSLKENLKRANFITPTAIQADALPPALEGKDVLGTAQTGTGKTLAFLLPILEKLLPTRPNGVEALVLLPTRELAMQVFETLTQLTTGLSMFTVLVAGGLSEFRQLKAIRSGARVVIATPGRLEDYLKRRLVDLSHVKILVLDESDRMVDMGFLPQMRNILRALPKERQTMCFSATLERSVAGLVRDYLKNPVRVQIGSVDKPTERVDLQAYEIASGQKVALLFHVLKTYEGTSLVFARTKHGAERLGRSLLQAGFSTGIIHGGRSQSQRNAALAGFKGGTHRILVATDVASRGIHVQGIAHVVNFDLPQTPQDFIHRVGRTGRVNARGLAFTFVTPQDFPVMRRIEYVLGVSVKRLPIPEGLPASSESKSTQNGPSPRRSGFGHAGGQGFFKNYFVPKRDGGSHRKPYHRESSSRRGDVRFPVNRRHNDN